MKKFGVFIDCVGNGAMNVSRMKEFIDVLSKMGYNLLEIGLDDMYRIEGEPYFGYLNGCYTKEEMREIDRYAKGRGVEVVPSIQTLAHMGRLLSNHHYKFKDIVVENGIPAIIDKDLFEKVQKRIAVNTRALATHKAKEEYLLSMKIFCGECDAIMFGESGTSKTGKTYTYYKSANQKRRHTCDKKTISKDKIENAVAKAVMEKVMDDNLMEELAHRLYDLQKQESNILNALQIRLAEVEQV